MSGWPLLLWLGLLIECRRRCHLFVCLLNLGSRNYRSPFPIYDELLHNRTGSALSIDRIGSQDLDTPWNTTDDTTRHVLRAVKRRSKFSLKTSHKAISCCSCRLSVKPIGEPDAWPSGGDAHSSPFIASCTASPLPSVLAPLCGCAEWGRGACSDRSP